MKSTEFAPAVRKSFSQESTPPEALSRISELAIRRKEDACAGLLQL